MGITIIDHALKGLVWTGRVIIARYREDCPRSDHSGRAVSCSRPGKASNIQLVDSSNAFHLKGKAAFWRILGVWLTLCVFFSINNM